MLYALEATQSPSLFQAQHIKKFGQKSRAMEDVLVPSYPRKRSQS